MVANRITVGTSRRRKVWFDPDRRSKHLHVVGGSGQGKSKFLEHLIREDVLAGHGLCLIDPHGELCNCIVDWCASIRADRFRKIHLVDPSNPSWRFCFNPLQRYPREKPRDRVDNVIEALAQVWGGEESQATPAIRTTLRAILTALIEHNQTLAEAFPLTGIADQGGRRHFLTQNLESPITRELWAGYEEAANRTPREFITEFGGVRRRLSELLDDAELRQMLGNIEGAIDFRRCMDEGDIVLVNLSAKGIGRDRARALGALLVREMFYVATQRNEAYAKDHPFYLYVDECADYLTDDVANLLAQTRKFGLHAILAHQWLQQLRDASPAIYAAIMAIQNKVVFGGLQDEDAMLLADELFRTEYDIEMPVETLIRPTVVGHTTTWLESWSESDSEGEADSEGTMEVEGSSMGASQAFDSDGYPLGGGVEFSGESASLGTSRSHTTFSGHSSSYGSHQTLKPVLEDRVSAVHSLENVRHLAVKRLRSIPERNAVVKGPGIPSFDIAAYTIRAPIVPEPVRASFCERLMATSPYMVSSVEAAEQLRLRELALQRKIDDANTATDADDEEFGFG